MQELQELLDMTVEVREELEILTHQVATLKGMAWYQNIFAYVIRYLRFVGECESRLTQLGQTHGDLVRQIRVHLKYDDAIRDAFAIDQALGHDPWDDGGWSMDQYSDLTIIIEFLETSLSLLPVVATFGDGNVVLRSDRKTEIQICRGTSIETEPYSADRLVELCGQLALE